MRKEGRKEGRRKEGRNERKIITDHAYSIVFTLYPQKTPPGMEISGLNEEIVNLSPKQHILRMLGVDFADTTQNLTIEVLFNEEKLSFSLDANVGEQLEPVLMSAEQFKLMQSLQFYYVF